MEVVKRDLDIFFSDMRRGNIILDATTGGLTAIIDWGNAAVADPALDFMGMFEIDRRLGEQAKSMRT